MEAIENRENPVAVFGGGGFIGSHLCERLVEQGNVVIAVDISSKKLSGLINNELLEFVEIDITNEKNDIICREIVESSSIVFDLIAYANPQEYIDKPIDVVELNLFENLKIVDYCVETETRLIQFSTCEVYGMVGGRKDPVFKEDKSNLILGPVGQQRWIYSCAKQLLERMVYSYGKSDNLNYTIVRPFNFIGPKMDYIIESPNEGTPRVFASFMSSLLYNHPIYLVDGGSNSRTFTHIDDAIEAILYIYENPDNKFHNEIVNVGARGNETTIKEFSKIMCDIYQNLSPDGSLPEIKEVPGKEFYGEGYEDCEMRIPDAQKLESVGWSPEYNLRELLRDTMKFYIQKYEKQQ